VLEGWSDAIDPRPENDAYSSGKKRFEEQVMIKHYVLSDMVTKATYVCLVAAAFVFIAMILMTGMHP
jgi:hypothetical protein